MVAFTGADNSISLFSRFVSRYARARTSGMRGCASAVGVLLALVVSLVATSERGPRSVDGFATWSDAPSVQSGAAIHSLALRRAADEARSQRRATPQFDPPLAADPSRAERRVHAPITAASAVITPPAAGLSARGYDATAPPSCA